ncbi:hypothetical protein HDU97_001707 [Phlyctochytrium planicorne]|nr:hypothetical protein HDU97_001707 [Phlyctochytrium planicorne]
MSSFQLPTLKRLGGGMQLHNLQQQQQQQQQQQHQQQNYSSPTPPNSKPPNAPVQSTSPPEPYLMPSRMHTNKSIPTQQQTPQHSQQRMQPPPYGKIPSPPTSAGGTVGGGGGFGGKRKYDVASMGFTTDDGVEIKEESMDDDMGMQQQQIPKRVRENNGALVLSQGMQMQKAMQLQQMQQQQQQGMVGSPIGSGIVNKNLIHARMIGGGMMRADSEEFQMDDDGFFDNDLFFEESIQMNQQHQQLQQQQHVSSNSNPKNATSIDLTDDDVASEPPKLQQQAMARQPNQPQSAKHNTLSLAEQQRQMMIGRMQQVPYNKQNGLPQNGPSAFQQQQHHAQQRRNAEQHRQHTMQQLEDDGDNEADDEVRGRGQTENFERDSTPSKPMPIEEFEEKMQEFHKRFEEKMLELIENYRKAQRYHDDIMKRIELQKEKLHERGEKIMEKRRAMVERFQGLIQVVQQ